MSAKVKKRYGLPIKYDAMMFNMIAENDKVSVEINTELGECVNIPVEHFEEITAMLSAQMKEITK